MNFFIKKIKIQEFYFCYILLLYLVISNYMHFYMFPLVIYYIVLNISFQSYYYYHIRLPSLLNLIMGIVKYMALNEYSIHTIVKKVSKNYISFHYYFIYIT